MLVELVTLDEYNTIYAEQQVIGECHHSQLLAGAGYANLVVGEVVYVPWSDASACGAPWSRKTDMNPTQFLAYWVPTTQRWWNDQQAKLKGE